MNLTGEKHRLLIERLIIIALFVVVMALFWSLRTLIVLALGAVVFSVALRMIANPLMRIPGVGVSASALLAVLICSLLLALLVWIFGQDVALQFSELNSQIPKAWQSLQLYIAGLPGGEQLSRSLNRLVTGPGIANDLAQMLLTIGNAVTALLLIVFGAIFFATDPNLYRVGLLKLVPKSSRELTDEAFGDVGRALKLWLLGQLISMVLVGLLTGIGLWLVGVPSAFALGIIAGVTEGIPYLGPILAAVPGLLLALAESPEIALWALLVYVVVQQVEGNTIVPLIQHRTVYLPPALTLFSLIAGGILFGLVGLIFAAPMLVVIYVLVKKLYVREALHTATPIPGDPRGDNADE